MPTTTDKRENLYELLKDFDTAMVVTRTATGEMHGRPMAIADLRADADVYFATSIDSPKVAEVEANPAVTLTFQSASQYATLYGRASIVRDRALIEKLWKETWKVWFPKGKEDPTLALLKFDAQSGEFWDIHGTKGLKQVFEAAMAYVKGETPKPDPERNSRVRL